MRSELLRFSSPEPGARHGLAATMRTNTPGPSGYRSPRSRRRLLPSDHGKINGKGPGHGGSLPVKINKYRGIDLVFAIYDKRLDEKQPCCDPAAEKRRNHPAGGYPSTRYQCTPEKPAAAAPAPSKRRQSSGWWKPAPHQVAKLIQTAAENSAAIITQTRQAPRHLGGIDNARLDGLDNRPPANAAPEFRRLPP